MPFDGFPAPTPRWSCQSLRADALCILKERARFGPVSVGDTISIGLWWVEAEDGGGIWYLSQRVWDWWLVLSGC